MPIVQGRTQRFLWESHGNHNHKVWESVHSLMGSYCSGNCSQSDQHIKVVTTLTTSSVRMHSITHRCCGHYLMERSNILCSLFGGSFKKGPTVNTILSQLLAQTLVVENFYGGGNPLPVHQRFVHQQILPLFLFFVTVIAKYNKHYKNSFPNHLGTPLHWQQSQCTTKTTF